MKLIIETTFVIVAMAAMGYVFAGPGIWDTPDVHFSNLTQECVKVINYKTADDYSCTNLPDLYTHVWVR
jgi:hypothetical protein